MTETGEGKKKERERQRERDKGSDIKNTVCLSVTVQQHDLHALLERPLALPVVAAEEICYSSLRNTE